MPSTMPVTESELLSLLQDGPQASIGTSAEYIDRMASAASHAMLPSSSWRLMFDTTEENRLQVYHSVITQHLQPGSNLGAFIIEAGDFSVCASWWPPGSHEPPKNISIEGLEDADGQNESIMAASSRKVDRIHTENVWWKYGQDFWHLVLLARDPRKAHTRGAVRAVLKPVVDRAAAEGKPIWVVTTSEHARNVYLHFGWRLVDTVTVRECSQWCLILNPPRCD